MKFNCDRLSDYLYQRKCEKFDNQQQWHPWFAWRPIRVAYRDCRWFETVQRRKIYLCGYYEADWKWEYK